MDVLNRGQVREETSRDTRGAERLKVAYPAMSEGRRFGGPWEYEHDYTYQDPRDGHPILKVALKGQIPFKEIHA